MKALIRTTVLLTFLILPVLLHAETADQFLKAYFLIQEGDSAEKGDEKGKASEKFIDAYRILQTIKRSSPDWNPNIIAYRTKYCAEHIIKNGGKIPEDHAPTTPPSESPSTSTPPSPAPAPETTSEPAPSISSNTTSSSDRVTALENELNQAKAQIRKLQEEKGDLEARLLKAEGDLKLAGMGGDERVQALLQENNSLKQRLSDAEARLKNIPAGSSDIIALRSDLDKAQKDLVNLKAENAQLKASNDSLKKDLDDTRTQLRTGSSGTATLTPEALQTLQKENSLLRSIVDRQFQEDAKRTAARDSLATELQELASKADNIRTRLEVLKAPLTPLSVEERRLLKTPAASIRTTSEDPTKLSGVVTAAKNSNGEASPPKLSGENAVLAGDARMLFSRGDMTGAAAKYEAILKNEPNNIFALSNLGVINFRQEKLDEAEKNLKKSLSLDPQDSFSLSVLGIVYFKLNKLDEAIQALTRSISITPNNHETHNYLGITYSQKGYQEAAERELLKAIELNPEYADAHFNLAVVYASQTPSSVELARKHYKKAIELGISRDPELEKLFGGKL